MPYQTGESEKTAVPSNYFTVFFLLYVRPIFTVSKLRLLLQNLLVLHPVKQNTTSKRNLWKFLRKKVVEIGHRFCVMIFQNAIQCYIICSTIELLVTISTNPTSLQATRLSRRNPTKFASSVKTNSVVDFVIKNSHTRFL